MKKCPYCEEEIQENAIKCRHCGERLEQKNQAFNSEKVIWKWKPKRWWIGLIVFWFVGVSGAGILARLHQHPKADSSFIIFAMMIFVIWCASKDRSWRLPMRILYVVGAWFVEAILTLPIGLIFIKTGFPASHHYLVGRIITLLGALPVILWAMRRSTFFVNPMPKKDY